MELEGKDREELIRTIHSLRWLLTGLGASGVEYWLTPSEAGREGLPGTEAEGVPGTEAVTVPGTQSDAATVAAVEAAETAVPANGHGLWATTKDESPPNVIPAEAGIQENDVNPDPYGIRHKNFQKDFHKDLHTEAVIAEVEAVAECEVETIPEPVITVEPLNAFTREAPPSPEDPLAPPCKPSLDAIRLEMGDCTLCRLHSTRTHLVFGDGFPETSLVFVGEGPGFDEDRQGKPFVGRAGKLLDKMIHSIGLRRKDVYICNVVKCRPPNNRTPNPDEIASCSPFLFKQLEAVQPRVICALGVCAAQTLLKTTRSVGALRNKIYYWRGIPLVVTYHPAYLLRTPAQKAAVWQDLKEARRILSEKH